MRSAIATRDRNHNNTKLSPMIIGRSDSTRPLQLCSLCEVEMEVFGIRGRGNMGDFVLQETILTWPLAVDDCRLRKQPT